MRARTLWLDEGTPPLGLHSVWETCVGGKEEIRLPEKRTVLHQHTERPEGVKAKNSCWIFSFTLLLFRFLAPLLSLSFSFGCCNSSWNIKTFQSSSTEMKASQPVHNWFLWGPTIPIEPSWLPVPCSGSAYDKETRKPPGDMEIMMRVKGRRSLCVSATFMKLQAFDLLSSSSSS